MNRREDDEFPFAYLSERPERRSSGNPPASPTRRSSPADGSRSMTQQIQILLLIAFATVLIFLILLYLTIMTITSNSKKTDSQTIQTSITQAIESSSETTSGT